MKSSFPQPGKLYFSVPSILRSLTVLLILRFSDVWDRCLRVFRNFISIFQCQVFRQCSHPIYCFLLSMRFSYVRVCDWKFLYLIIEGHHKSESFTPVSESLYSSQTHSFYDVAGYSIWRSQLIYLFYFYYVILWSRSVATYPSGKKAFSSGTAMLCQIHIEGFCGLSPL
jgi:hypothetical protein